MEKTSDEHVTELSCMPAIDLAPPESTAVVVAKSTKPQHENRFRGRLGFGVKSLILN
jgi:hypothetical protein